MTETLLHGLDLAAGSLLEYRSMLPPRDLLAGPIDQPRQLIGVLGDRHGSISRVGIALAACSICESVIAEQLPLSIADRSPNRHRPLIRSRPGRAVVHARECPAKRGPSGDQPKSALASATTSRWRSNRHRQWRPGSRRRQLGESRGNRDRPRFDRGRVDQPDVRARLPAEHPHQVRIGHRRQRMVTHRRIREELVPTKRWPA